MLSNPTKVVVCAATPGSGVRHRFMVLSALKHFADRNGYSVCMLWGVTRGVAHCRFEELFAPLPGVRIVNISEEALAGVAECADKKRAITFGSQPLSLFRPDQPRWKLHDRFFSWDLSGAFALAHKVGAPPRHLIAPVSRPIQERVAAYVRRHGLESRLGIRVRVEEYHERNRKPHRIQRELDEVVASIIRLPWHSRVFIATDSHYIQSMLASHFNDAQFIAKQFDLREKTGNYVHRQDKRAMFTFLEEVDCLCRCRKIINIGGFLNERSVQRKILCEPYTDAITWTPATARAYRIAS
jgi:hypothetical protein